MVPVLDSNKQPLMPCKEKRAKTMMKKGEAVAYWQKGIFCIKLTKEPSNRSRQPIVLGIDPGSKREGYTVATKKRVVLNITSNTPDWVKEHIETRKSLRRARRYRKTPYRQCRKNRATLRISRVPPSTKARWQAKLRIVSLLLRVIPISLVNVEDIKAIAKKGQGKWNTSFSPLEVGKKWFYNELEKLGLALIKTDGKQTKQYRVERGFKKSKKKLDYTWEAHNVDSHSLAEMTLAAAITPYTGLYQLNFLQYRRRQLHVQIPAKNNVRRSHGSTVSLGLPRGSVVSHKDKLYYLGGSSKGKVAIHSIITGVRIKQHTNVGDIEMLYSNRWRTQFLPRSKSWSFLRKFA